MKRILFLSVGILTIFLQTASAQYPIGAVNGLESWENTLDGWVMNPGGQNNAYTYAFGTTTGVTDGSYCLALTGTDYPSYGQMLATPSSTNLTALLADCASISLSVYVPAGAFNNILQFDWDIYNADTGYQTLEGYIYVPAYKGGPGGQTNISITMPASIAAQLDLSTNPTTLYIQIGGSYTVGNETMYLDGFQIHPQPQGTVPSPTRPSTLPTNTFFAQSASGVVLFESSHGIKPLYYQWQTDGASGGSLTNIPGATDRTYTFNTTVPGTYKFDVIVSNSYNGYSAATSLVAQVYVLPASVPILTTAVFPTNVLGFVGGNVSFYANFGLGTVPLTNQWLFSSTGTGYAPVAGVGNNPWTCTNVQPSSAGFYKLSATNVIGSSNSSPAHLTALADLPAPTIANAGAASYCLYTNKGLVAYWKFEETQDTFLQSMQAYDYSGHNLHATYGNSIPGDTTQTTGCYDGYENYLNNTLNGPNSDTHYTGFVSGNYAAFMNSSAVNGTLTAPPLNLNTNTVTITMWIYPFPVSSGTGTNAAFSAVGANTGLLMNRNGTDGAGVGFSSYVNTNFNGASLGYTWNSNNAATIGWNSGLYPLSQKWSMVTYVITPSNATIYLYYVGVAPGTSTVKTNMLKAVHSTANISEAFSGGTTWIGGDNGNVNLTFPGSIDEVAVYTNAMTEGQVQDIYLKALGVAGVAPVINTQPANMTIFQGQFMSNSVVATAVPNPTYQWQFAQGAVGNNLWTNVVNTGSSIVGATSSSLAISNFPPSGPWNNRTNFRVIVMNGSGSVTSSPANVNFSLIPNYNGGSWTMNFAITTINDGGTGTPFSGHGLLGTGTYWNALNADSGQVTNVTSLLDDGTTSSSVKFRSQAGINVSSDSSLALRPTNNLLLDTYAIISTKPTPFVFSNIPNGKYNLALYGCVGNWLDRAITFTVLTNGVIAGNTAALTNLQDVLFARDNTVVFTNLIVVNQKLEVDIGWVPTALHTNTVTGEGEFNGAQLQLLQGGPTPGAITPSGANLVFYWSGGGLQYSTNVQGPWTTNVGALSPFTFAPTGAVKFFRIVNSTNY